MCCDPGRRPHEERVEATATVPRPGSVAIIITTYNHASFLEVGYSQRSCCRPVRPTEIIVVDDGSTDHPEAVTSPVPRRPLDPSAERRAVGRAQHRMAGRHERVRRLPRRRRPAAAGGARRQPASASAQPGGGILVRWRTSTWTPSQGADVRSSSSRRPMAFLPSCGETCRDARRLSCTGERNSPNRGFDAWPRRLRGLRRLSADGASLPVVCGPMPLAEYWHHGGNMSRDSAMMLRQAVLTCLRRQRPAAGRLAVRRAYREGVAGWKRHYVRAWCLELCCRAIRTGSLRDRSLVRKGPPWPGRHR